MWFAELFAELLLFFEDLKFWNKKRARRRYEKENNLPKKIMIYPSDRIYVIAIIVLAISGGLLMFVFSRNIKEDRTIKKLTKIENLLEAEKKKYKVYPSELSMVIRNNPLHKNLLTDAWDNSFHYKSYDNGLDYVVFSRGKDGKLHTDDDIKLK